ncbi:hypothetical protein ACFLVJ_01680 [Chloroflexota bacterium]
MATEIKWVLDHIFPLLILSMLHWILAIMLLEDIKTRERILGWKKWMWVVLITSVAFLGSLLYLLSHPKIFIDTDPK